jgi:hypothetical protein
MLSYGSGAYYNHCLSIVVTKEKIPQAVHLYTYEISQIIELSSVNPDVNPVWSALKNYNLSSRCNLKWLDRAGFTEQNAAFLEVTCLDYVFLTWLDTVSSMKFYLSPNGKGIPKNRCRYCANHQIAA